MTLSTFDYDGEPAAAFQRLRFANSYSRMGALLALSKHPRFWQLVGQEWSDCDNIAAYRRRLLPILRRARKFAPVRDAMTEAERGVIDQLPEVVTIYRGCFLGLNDDGFSWTLDREIASSFPTLARYRHEGGRAVVIHGQVRRDRIIFFHDGRNEREIIVVPDDVTVVAVEDIKGAVV